MRSLQISFNHYLQGGNKRYNIQEMRKGGSYKEHSEKKKELLDIKNVIEMKNLKIKLKNTYENRTKR